MAKICFYTHPHPNVQTYFEMIDLAVEHGLYAVEGLSTFDLAQPNLEHAKYIKEYADSKGVKFPCFSVFINLVGQDGADMMQRLKGYADVAKILGSPFLHHTIASDYRNPDNVLPYRNEFFKKGVAAAAEIFDYCEQKGIRTLVEEQGYLFNGISGMQTFLDAINRNVGLVADLGNIYQADEKIDDYITAFGGLFAHAHVKDVKIIDDNLNGTGLKTVGGRYMHIAELGFGDVDVKQAIGRLKKTGYDGYYAIEHTVQKENVKQMVQTVNTWIEGK